MTDRSEELNAMPARSLGLVKAGNRDAWLALFEDDGVVEDPVGKSPFDPEGRGHRGKEKIAAFYDNVIANAENFDFKIHTSIARGDEVAAYVTLYTGGVGNEAINIYNLSPSGKIISLRSFWKWPENAG